MKIWQKKIAVSILLKLQLTYCLLGVGYNIISCTMAVSGGRQLSANSPIAGGIFMSVYGLCLITGYKELYKTYRLLMLFFLIITGYSGILQHFIMYVQQPAEYASFSAWISAIIINIFGFLLNLMVVAGRFDAKPAYELTSQTFVQPIDHNNPDGETFEQEILILKPEEAALDSPVFFILGNESDATLEELSKLYRAYGSPKNIVFIQAEHRGYGQSITSDDDQSLPHYIQIDQALADYHQVVTAFKTEYTGSWMAAGYSYGGGLVINFAYQYPDDVKVILASSAVIDWPFYMPATVSGIWLQMMVPGREYPLPVLLWPYISAV